MTDISVDVTIEQGTATYKSSNDQVQEDGTITIDEGEDATITFAPAPGQTWSFESPWVVIDPTGGDIQVQSTAPSSVTLTDDNPKGPPSTYTYALQTTLGPLDPRLINKGGTAKR